MTSEAELNIRVGAAIRVARLSRGVTQDDLGKLLGVDRTMISRYERGLRTLSAPALLTIFQYLEYPLPTLEGSSLQLHDSEISPSLPPALESILAKLRQRPDLIPTVEEVLETFLSADQ
ncbi:MAG: helix-turn-helix domain-containing protein [Chloroflexota bacterium]|nr:helix-turn-helix domain-containing protein [Chloroflexota bacterium]